MRLTTLALLAFVFPTLSFAIPIVLDDYSSDANFAAGNYQFIDVRSGFRRPDENGNPPPTNALPDISVLDGNLSILSVDTAGHMWIGGEMLSQVGDRVSININVTQSGFFHAYGMFFDTDLANAYGGAEIRYQSGNLNNSKLMPSGPEHVSTPIVFNDPDSDHSAYINEWTHYEASVIDVGVDTITIRVRLTSDVFQPTLTEVTLNGTQLYFGPSAWFGGTPEDEDLGRPLRRWSLFDNLTYTPAPEPSSLALLGITGMLLARRHRFQ